MNKDFWNERYGQESYAFGCDPNVFFAGKIDELPPGKLLLPAEGEGRNAVYAATLGWDVTAFDMSEAGKVKSDQLAQLHNVSIKYEVGTFDTISYPINSFDCIALIYAHFDGNLRSEYHRLLNSWLKPEGVLLFEAFSKSHLSYNTKNPSVGGPKDANYLYSIDEVKNDFPGMDWIVICESEVNLSEGIYHVGLGHVVRCVGRKHS